MKGSPRKGCKFTGTVCPDGSRASMKGSPRKGCKMRRYVTWHELLCEPQ